MVGVEPWIDRNPGFISTVSAVILGDGELFNFSGLSFFRPVFSPRLHDIARVRNTL